MRKVFTWPAKSVRIPLNPDGKDHMLGLVNVLAGLDLEEVICLLDRVDQFRAIDLNLVLLYTIMPTFEDMFPCTSFERYVTAQRNHARLCHDMLFLLIVEDRIGEFSPFKHEDTQPLFLRMNRCT